MKRKNKNNRHHRNGVTQTLAARALGVSRGHLNYVLNGRRQSTALLRRYKNLLAVARATARTTAPANN